MADLSATYGIDLRVGGSEDVEKTTKSLEALRSKIKADTDALRQMQATMRSLQAGTNVNVATFKKLRDQIAAKKVAIAQASQQLANMKGGFESVRPPVKGAIANIAQFLGVSKGLAIGVLGFTAAIAAATVGIIAFGIATADARRSEGIMLQAASAVASFRGELWGLGSAAVATEKQISAMQGVIDRTSASVPIGRDEVARYAQQLVRARLAGQDFEKALQAVSTAASVGADASGLVSAFAGIKFLGGSVDALANRVKTKFGGIVQRQMLSLDVQSKKLRENWRALFRDVNVEPFLRGLNDVLSLFSTSTAAGYGLREMFTALFKPLGDSVSFLSPLIKGFFKGLVVSALMFTIALLTIRNWFRDTFDIGKSKIDWLTVGMWAGVAAGGAFLGTIALIGASLALAAAPFVALGAAIYYVGKAFVYLWNLDWPSLGKAIIDGIVRGLKAAAGFLWDAIKGIGKGALSAFGTSIDAHSPSREFFKYGRYIPQGAAGGVEAEAPRVQAAVDRMVKVPTSGPGGGLSTGAGVVVHVTIQALHVNAPQAKDAREIAQAMHGPLADVFEELAQQLGARLEPA